LTIVSFQGFFEAIEKGSLSGNPITGCRFVLKDGSYHQVDSSELAFRLCTIYAFREAYRAAKPIILEPIMTVEVVAPSEFQSAFGFCLNNLIDIDYRDTHKALSLVALIHGVVKLWTAKYEMMSSCAQPRWPLTTCLDIQISCVELRKAKVG